MCAVAPRKVPLISPGFLVVGNKDFLGFRTILELGLAKQELLLDLFESSVANHEQLVWSVEF